MPQVRAGDLSPIKKSRARPGAPDATWTLEPHVCRHCFGRLASTPGAPGLVVYACTNCGATATGPTPGVLCSCGLQLRRPGAPTGFVDAGIRCQPNPAPSSDFPSLFVAAQVAP
jgi:hypothetical protein